MGLIKQRQVYDVTNINADRFYKLSREVSPLKMETYRCILEKKTENALTFMYAYNYTKFDVDTGRIEIKVEDINNWNIEVIE